MIETILVATDGSEAVASAERFGIALTARLRARLSGSTVVEDRDVRPPNDGGLGVPGFPEAEVVAYFRARAEATARRFSERARAEGIAAVVATHDPALGVPVVRPAALRRPIPRVPIGLRGPNDGSGGREGGSQCPARGGRRGAVGSRQDRRSCPEGCNA